jgi:FixJ family two-component response regulator
MANNVITAKSVQSDTLYRAGSTIVNVRSEGISNGEPETTDPFVFMFEAIVCYDSKLNIVWTNGYARHLFGLTDTQIKSGKCYEMFYKKKSYCVGCPIIRTIETGNEHTAKVMHSNGKIMFVRSYPIKDENGFVSGVVAITQNISNDLHHQDVTDAYVFGGRMSRLTSREQEVMQLVAEGCQNKEIGTKLGISPKTVEIHRARVMDKLQIRSTAQLVRYLTKYEIFGNYLAQ